MTSVARLSVDAVSLRSVLVYRCLLHFRGCEDSYAGRPM